ncbi:MAG: carboxypeptidase-like regulatory domain-containing protein [Bacteroidales bacterium]|nr:carboxypeptidase-like regulatory domain-containing protein [Bacteroidales bacterium]
MDVLNYVKKNNTPKKIVITLILITGFSFATAQEGNVLESRLTLRLNNVSISNILKTISRRTAYHFTYDTDLIEPGRISTVRMTDRPLKNILDTLFSDRKLDYSIIDNHIIIYRPVSDSTPLIREEGRKPVYTLSGVVTDADNGQPLPYASIGIKSRGLGTVSNYEGEFDLNLSGDFLDDTLVISYMGFYNRMIPVNQAINSHYNIELTRKYVPIPEVIIRNRQPLELIRYAKEHLTDNYGSSPVRMTAFYRESVSKKDKILLYSEAVLELYKSSYAATLLNDQVKIYKSRKINNLDQSDTLTFKLKSGLDGCLSLDGVKNTFDFLREKNFNDYDYNMTDIINIGDEAAFVIEFEQKETVNDLALLKGVIYINTANYGIHGAEFEINREHIDKLERTVIQRTARGFRVKARSIRYRVNYRYINGRYFLNHVRGDLEFFARKKGSLFGNQYSIFFEMAVNDIDTVNVERFDREERAPVHSIFSETIDGYDPEFWGTDNFVAPEESIREALSRINARLGEYTTNNFQ